MLKSEGTLNVEYGMHFTSAYNQEIQQKYQLLKAHILPVYKHKIS